MKLLVWWKHNNKTKHNCRRWNGTEWCWTEQWQFHSDLQLQESLYTHDRECSQSFRFCTETNCFHICITGQWGLWRTLAHYLWKEKIPSHLEESYVTITKLQVSDYFLSSGWKKLCKISLLTNADLGLNISERSIKYRNNFSWHMRNLEQISLAVVSSQICNLIIRITRYRASASCKISNIQVILKLHSN